MESRAINGNEMNEGGRRSSHWNFQRDKTYSTSFSREKVLSRFSHFPIFSLSRNFHENLLSVFLQTPSGAAVFRNILP
jgi:hypothetical protein